jgi:hypothetical protein
MSFIDTYLRHHGWLESLRALCPIVPKTAFWCIEIILFSLLASIVVSQTEKKRKV